MLRPLEQVDESLKLHKKILKYRQRILGDWHMDVQSSCAVIGFIHLEQDEHALALACFNQVVEIIRHNLGEKHRKLAQAYFYIGCCKRALGDMQGEFSILSKAYTICGDVNMHGAEELAKMLIGRLGFITVLEHPGTVLVHHEISNR